ncbi:MAG: hypothetical protein F6J90_06750 [Moorea sp. SIOASIH]|uniref:hypothetical protein n=1 Tax=Moorena sp. SIOASIH TaxID=2607817 RepID=UPI0013BA4B07|nr:hypothetical protein [Moorena sp. SIOASIH]NEO36037.1 hypothetical protein [Moorena sp. SIOASIH]
MVRKLNVPYNYKKPYSIYHIGKVDKVACLLPFASCLLPIASCLLPTPYSLLPTPYSQQYISPPKPPIP